MNLLNKQYRTSDNNIINYYEIENNGGSSNIRLLQLS